MHVHGDGEGAGSRPRMEKGHALRWLVRQEGNVLHMDFAGAAAERRGEPEA